MHADPQITIFERSAPQGRCSLCGSKAGPFHLEPRRTGRNLAIQEWPYCERCWIECESEAEKVNHDLGLIVVWLGFLRALATGRDIESEKASAQG